MYLPEADKVQGAAVPWIEFQHSCAGHEAFDEMLVALRKRHQVSSTGMNSASLAGTLEDFPRIGLGRGAFVGAVPDHLDAA